MQRLLIVDHEKCTGCRLCELVCSVKKTGTSNPSRARINVIKWEADGFYLPMLCQNCQSAACMAVCPTDAIFRDTEVGRVMVDYDKCIGCFMCVAACPFGGVGIDAVEDKVIKCDLCDGEPTCVSFCDPKAIDYVDVSTATLRKKRSAGERFSELLRKFVG